MADLIDKGFLKTALRNSLGINYVPHLYKQIHTDLTNIENVQNSISNILEGSAARWS